MHNHHQDNFLALVEELRPYVKEVDVTYIPHKNFRDFN